MDLRVIILRKLVRHRIIGGKHTAIENLVKGMPRHVVGDAKKAVHELMKEGFLVGKPTSYGLKVSLNPERIDEIMDFIEG